ncbi:MAG TPA: hypothetical protein VGP47_03760 [Parachlamydiaceae bacterium]|nr:hypothetical protein [Parachlamydiaceae bacterium]
MNTLSHFLSILFLINMLSCPLFAAPKDMADQTIQFIPPAGWRIADETALLKHVKLMVVGKGSNEFPPSISLALEPYSGTLKQYLKIVKELNASKGNEWKDLGSIRTEAGNASFTQTESKSQWGEIKMMHVMLKKDGNIYILTAAALRDEFPKFYKEIFASLRSLHFSSTTEFKAN